MDVAVGVQITEGRDKMRLVQGWGSLRAIKKEIKRG